MSSGTIFDIKHFSTHDGPGIRTTVFLKGCPLRCVWCHNPESQKSYPQLMLSKNFCINCLACLAYCPQEVIKVKIDGPFTDRDLCTNCGECVPHCYSGAREMSGYDTSVKDVLDEIKKDIPFYDQSGGGVTLSGGEPLFQPKFTLQLLKGCKEMELHTTLDTSGHAPWAVLEKTLPLTDLYLFDLKAIDEGLHKSICGASNKIILENLQRLDQSGKAIILRMPLVTDLNDSQHELRSLGEVASQLYSVKYLEMLPYHLAGQEKYERLGWELPAPGLKEPTIEHVNNCAVILREYGLRVQIGG